MIDVARRFPSQDNQPNSSLSETRFKNELLASITIGSKSDRYVINHGPSAANQFGYHWFELKDMTQKVKTGRESKSDFKSVRRNQEDNTQHTIGIAYKELFLTFK